MVSIQIVVIKCLYWNASVYIICASLVKVTESLRRWVTFCLSIQRKPWYESNIRRSQFTWASQGRRGFHHSFTIASSLVSVFWYLPNLLTSLKSLSCPESQNSTLFSLSELLLTLVSNLLDHSLGQLSGLQELSLWLRFPSNPCWSFLSRVSSPLFQF